MQEAEHCQSGQGDEPGLAEHIALGILLVSVAIGLVGAWRLRPRAMVAVVLSAVIALIAVLLLPGQLGNTQFGEQEAAFEHCIEYNDVLITNEVRPLLACLDGYLKDEDKARGVVARATQAVHGARGP